MLHRTVWLVNVYGTGACIEGVFIYPSSFDTESESLVASEPNSTRLGFVTVEKLMKMHVGSIRKVELDFQLVRWFSEKLLP